MSKLGRLKLRGLSRRVRSLGRGVVADATWGSVFEVVLLLSSLVTFIVLTRDLGPTSFGYYSAIQGLVTVLATVATAWVGPVLLQNAVREGEDLPSLISSLLSWTIVGALAALAVTVGVAHLLIPKVSVVTTLIFVAAEVVGNSMLQFSATVIQGVQGFARSARPRIVLESAQAVLIGGLWVAHDVSLRSFAIGNLGVNAGVGAVALVLCSRACHVRMRLGRPRLGHVRRGSLYATVLLSFAIEEDADKTLLVHFGFFQIAGLYSAAYRIVQIGLVPLRAMVSSMHTRFLVHDPEALGEHRRRSLRFTLPSAIYGVVVTVGLVVCAPLVPKILGSSYAGTVSMIRLLSLLILFRSFTLFAFNGLMGLGRTGFRTVVLGISAIVNLVINLTLIPRFSWKASVLATVAGEIVYLTLTWVGLIVFQRRHDDGVQRRQAAVG